jgi:hypothetical protein
MRELVVRTACFFANLVLGEPRVVITAAQEKELALSRANDPYFHAFRNHCMSWVYGNDPRCPVGD